jgi:hypothetical protein
MFRFAVKPFLCGSAVKLRVPTSSIWKVAASSRKLTMKAESAIKRVQTENQSIEPENHMESLELELLEELALLPSVC